jgi:O-glycosyl hydrolase
MVHASGTPFVSVLRLLSMVLVAAGAACAGATSGPDDPPGGPPVGTCRDLGTALPTSSATVTVDVSRTFQTIQGFGSTERLFDDPHVTETFDPVTQRAAVVISPAEQAKILDALYGDLGLTRVRWLPEGSKAGMGGIEPVNDNTDPEITDLSKFSFGWKKSDGHVDFVKSVRPRGVTAFFASPLSLESWITESNPAEYVEWAIVLLRHWRDLGVEMPYYSIVNEPGHPARLWSGQWLREVVKRLGAKLEGEGFTTKLVVPDDLNPSQALQRLTIVLADPEARRHVGAIAYHLYGGPESRSAVRQLSEQYSIPVWMTEYFDADWMRWARTMHELLAIYNVTAIDYMWAFFGQWEGRGAELVTINYTGTTYTGFRLNRQYFVVGQYSRFVRPGARRVQTVSSDPGLPVSGWLNGSELAFVVINGTATPRAVRFELGSAAPCAATVQAVTTGATDQWRALSPIAVDQPRFVATLPPNSITTLVAR